MSYRVCIATICVLFAASCKTVPDENDRAARITDANDASRAALQKTVNEIIGTDVMLADTALTDRSVLVIENWPRPSLQNPRPQGRIMEEPIRLLLVINEGRCILIDSRDGSRYLLENVTCVAE